MSGNAAKTAATSPRQLTAARQVLEEIAGKVNSRFSIRLWDGSEVPMGLEVEPGLAVSISDPGVITSLIRKPTPENAIRHYARGHLDFHGADLWTFVETVRVKGSRSKAKSVSKLGIAKSLLPFLFGAATDPRATPNGSESAEHEYDGDAIGHGREQAENRDFIQFHYDLSNDFYKLFLDPRMVYSCAYFTDWNNSLEQAQFDKLDITCRKLRLQPGERFLDIGCGWGALVIHAAQHYGVHAHGITLADEQLAEAQERVNALGLQDRVTLEIRDYAHLVDRGEKYDKIASVGMVEHVGIDNMRLYMSTVSKLLDDGGMFLCHGITRPAKKSAKDFRKIRPERRLLAKYIFPGGELDHIGHMVEQMEAVKFEVHDVEGWRDHYAMTCRHWAKNLEAKREEAVAIIGEEKYRLWLLYLVGVGMALGNGSACIYQTLASKRTARRLGGQPPTRSHLYEPGAVAELKRAA